METSSVTSSPVRLWGVLPPWCLFVPFQLGPDLQLSAQGCEAEPLLFRLFVGSPMLQLWPWCHQSSQYREGTQEWEFHGDGLVYLLHRASTTRKNESVVRSTSSHQITLLQVVVVLSSPSTRRRVRWDLPVSKLAPGVLSICLLYISHN